MKIDNRDKEMALDFIKKDAGKIDKKNLVTRYATPWGEIDINELDKEHLLYALQKAVHMFNEQLKENHNERMDSLALMKVLL